MPSDSRQSERRKHKRFNVKDLAIAVPNRPSSQIARIVNISKGGMAVRYLEQSDWLGNAEVVDILVNSNFLMANYCSMISLYNIPLAVLKLSF